MKNKQKCLVLDANILIRAVLGQKVRSLIIQYAGQVHFYAPDVCYQDAQKYLPILMKKRKLPVDCPLAVLTALVKFVEVVDKSLYEGFENSARQRMSTRDIDDWPVLALALTLNCPIWTEDADFFGSGVATWTTDRVYLFLEA